MHKYWEILKGRNPVPWIDSNILNLIKKKNSVRHKLKSHPNAGLRDKFKSLRAQVKKLLRESPYHFYDSIDTGFRLTFKRLWSILRLHSKSYPIPGHVSMGNVPDFFADQSKNSSWVSADKPTGIVDPFNRFFCLCIYYRQRSGEDSVHTFGHDSIRSDLTLNASTVLTALKALEVGKATGPDKIPAKLLKKTASVIVLSLM